MERTIHDWSNVPLVFNVAYAAMLLNISEQTVRYRARRGEIPATKKGKSWIFEREAVRDWLKNPTASPEEVANCYDYTEPTLCSQPQKMNNFELLKSITGIKEYTNQIFYLFDGKTRQEIEGLLAQELTEEGLQTVKSIAQSGDYPLSFDWRQPFNVKGGANDSSTNHPDDSRTSGSSHPNLWILP